MDRLTLFPEWIEEGEGLNRIRRQDPTPRRTKWEDWLTWQDAPLVRMRTCRARWLESNGYHYVTYMQQHCTVCDLGWFGYAEEGHRMLFDFAKASRDHAHGLVQMPAWPQEVF